MTDIKEIINLVKENNPDIDTLPLEKAYAFASIAHQGQKRLSGIDYIEHPLATAKRLAMMNLDLPIIIAGLLHDVPEETAFTLDDIKKDFGKDVAKMVEGITKLSNVKYRGIERYAENLRKMFLAMAKDVRVILIKFADRINNMETLEAQRPDKRLRIAKETLEIYAPIAGRLGMGEIKNILEELSFPYVYPKEYVWVKELAETRARVEKKYIEKIKQILSKELAEEEIPIINITGRIKEHYSLYKKLLEKNRDIDKVYDLVAIRIIAQNVTDCYRILGIIHKRWSPLKGRIKDYIAQPKPNGYQSLHTTVFADHGRVVEFQIRDQAMHELAEYGIAAHWHYKELSKKKFSKEQMEWMEGLIAIHQETKNQEDYLDKIKVDIFHDHIFVLTPKGDVIDLPEGATPVDFAYHIHSDVGNRCVGAIVNEKMTALDSALKSGDLIEIVTNKTRNKPNPDWLDFVKTTLAKEKIKEALKDKKTGLVDRLLGGNKNK